ncbi:MAG TPA: hypothetical protein VK553_12055 [Candidatus Nitrosopolaris rasttigaisensis]|nr:hypothetical protein [Candidatus Nitrosopolaris rasttigaisensis]
MDTNYRSMEHFIKEMEKDNFIFEPLLMYFQQEKWTHPFIEQYCNFEIMDEHPDMIWDNSGLMPYRIQFYSRNNPKKFIVCEKEVVVSEFEIIVKANSKKNLDRFWRKNIKEYQLYLDSGEKGSFRPSKKLEKLSNEATLFFTEHLELMLCEDCWGPVEQFCFSDFGEKVNEWLSENDWYITWSPDVCIDKNEDETYDFST